MKVSLLSGFIAFMFASMPVRAEIPVWDIDADLAVAVAKANLLAAKGAVAVNRCMAYYASPDQCTKTQDGTGRWQCRAAYSKYKKGCKGHDVHTEVREAVENIKALCSEGRESACAAAVSGG